MKVTIEAKKRMIEVQNVSFVYPHNNEEENVIALDGIDFHINKGEFLGIIGHNGSGKSTLAKLFNAIIFPTQGNVIVNGFNTKDQEHLWDIRQTAGMVFQNPDNQLVATIVEEDVRVYVRDDVDIRLRQHYQHRWCGKYDGRRQTNPNVYTYLCHGWNRDCNYQRQKQCSKK